ncbi:isoamylase early set domain-containing protein [Thermodesulfobacteriota bacterium]
MSKKKSKQKATAIQKIKRKRVSFSIEAPVAEQVVLMGDFNKWDPNVHPMKNHGNGIWTKSVIIPPGEYEYKFLIDGDWKEDPGNEKTCPNCFGTLNSILNLG